MFPLFLIVMLCNNEQVLSCWVVIINYYYLLPIPDKKCAGAEGEELVLLCNNVTPSRNFVYVSHHVSSQS